jgi:hypothetical protein
VAETRVIGQCERSALIDREPPQRRANSVLALIGLGLQVGVTLARDLVLPPVDALLDDAATGPPIFVDRSTGDHSENPNPHTTPRSVIQRRRPPHLHECFLHDLLSIKPALAVTQSAVVGSHAMAVVEALKGRLVAAAGTCEQTAIRQREVERVG